MRRHLELYIRSLAEREQPMSGPQNRQDLGTFLTWLLRAEGYQIIVPAYRFAGPERQSNVGYSQEGIDLFAVTTEGGTRCLHRFVLKAGDITKRNFLTEKGVQTDLMQLISRPSEKDRWLVGLGEETEVRVRTVVVHNGNFEDEHLAPSRAAWGARFAARGEELDWWEARHLVDKAAAVLEATTDPAALFPPAVQPFVSLVLDGLRVHGQERQARDDAGDVEHRLTLALGHWLAEPGSSGEGYDLRRPSQAERAINEVALFCALAERVASLSKPVPWLDLAMVVERSLCRAADAVRHHPGRATLTQPLELMADQVIGIWRQVWHGLAPIAAVPDGLAVLGASEQVDYPIRAWWIAGRLAVASRLARDRGDLTAAAEVAGAVHTLVQITGCAALRTPVTDDVVAELIVIAHVLLRAGRREDVGRWMAQIIGHLDLRRRLGLPGPSTWHRARLPMDEATAGELTAVWLDPATSRAAHGFTDEGSILLAVCVWIGTRLHALDERPWEAFRPRRVMEGREAASSVTPQIWTPPEDLWDRWYREEITDAGTAHLLEHEPNLLEFAATVESKLVEPTESPMEVRGLGGVDALASIVHRHPLLLARWLTPVRVASPG